MSGSPLSRRAVLRSGGVVGVLGAAVVSGCDLDPTSSPAAPAPAPTDPDQTIVDSARAELTTLIGRLRATSLVVGQAAAARSGPASLVAVHRTQLGALGGDPPPAGPRGRAFSPTELVAHERRAAARFAHWSLTCNNGDLARVLASVATGIRMQPVLRSDAS